MKTFNCEKLVEIQIQLWYHRKTAFESSDVLNPSKIEGNINRPMAENTHKEQLKTKDEHKYS